MNMKTENLTHAEAVQAMMDGHIVEHKKTNDKYRIHANVIQVYRHSLKEWAASEFFFTASRLFSIESPEPKKVKKTFYRAYGCSKWDEILESPWMPTEKKARDYLTYPIIKIETREFEIEEKV